MRERGLLAALLAAAGVAAALQASASGAAARAPSETQVVTCLRHAHWKVHPTVADGAALLFATSGKVSWTISLAPPKPHAGSSGATPTAKERSTLARCLR